MPALASDSSQVSHEPHGVGPPAQLLKVPERPTHSEICVPVPVGLEDGAAAAEGARGRRRCPRRAGPAGGCRAGLVVLDQPQPVAPLDDGRAVGALGGLADDLACAVVHFGDAGLGDKLVGESARQREQVAGGGLQRREQGGRVAGARTGGGAGRRGAEHPRPRARGEDAGSGNGAAAEEVASTEGHGTTAFEAGGDGRRPDFAPSTDDG